MCIYLRRVIYAWYFARPPFSLCPWIYLFSHFSLSNIRHQPFLYESFAISLLIPPSDGSDQRQPNDASKRDIAKATGTVHDIRSTKFMCFLFPFFTLWCRVSWAWSCPWLLAYTVLTTSQYSFDPWPLTNSIYDISRSWLFIAKSAMKAVIRIRNTHSLVSSVSDTE